MLTILINGSIVELHENTSFTLTRENPLLTGSEDYSFDLTIPLHESVSNQAIFGTLHLPGTPLPDTPYSFRLLAGKLDIEGLAFIEKCTEKDLSLRLVSGISAIAAMGERDGKPVYLDKIPHIEGWYVTPSGGGASLGGVSIDPSARKTNQLAVKSTNQAIYNPTNKTLYNFENSPLNGKENSVVTAYLNGKEKSRIDPPQLQLLDVVRILVAHFGFSFSIHSEGKSWWELVHIANARISTRPQHLLPHWTFPEFLREIELFFGARIEVRGRQIRLTPREVFSQRKVSLNMVTDERIYTVETDKRDRVHPSSMRYDLQEAPPQILLPQNIIEQADIRVVNSGEELRQSVSQMEEEERHRTLFVETSTDSRWAYLKNHATGRYSLYQVDVFSPYTPTNAIGLAREAAKTLRIVPARRDEFHILKPDSFSAESNFSLDKELNPLSSASEGGREKAAEVKVLEVFLKDPHERDLLLSPPFPLGTTMGYIDNVTGLAQFHPTAEAAKAFRLYDKQITPELARVDTLRTISIRFADRLNSPSAQDIYHFNNGDYLCRKITLRIDVYGISPVTEAEMHPLS